VRFIGVIDAPYAGWHKQAQYQRDRIPDDPTIQYLLSTSQLMRDHPEEFAMRHKLRPMVACVLFAIAASASACRTGSRAHDYDERHGDTTVSVENHDFLDMTIYVLRTGTRIRLGLAPGHSTTVLKIPDYLVNAGDELQFLCDPIGAARSPISQRISVWPGDQILLIVSTGT
jgi:hypothetical protein